MNCSIELNGTTEGIQANHAELRVQLLGRKRFKTNPIPTKLLILCMLPICFNLFFLTAHSEHWC